MNSLSRISMKSAHNINIHRAPIKHSHHPKIVLTARRRFSENSSLEPKKSLYPLHNAVKKGNVDDVKEVLKTNIVEVNGLNDIGELPLVIAAKKYSLEKKFPGKMLKLLYEYGACFLLEDIKGVTALTYLPQWKGPTDGPENLLNISITIDSMKHMAQGCGLPISRCTNRCKEESKYYSPEFKARVALESLSTNLAIENLASKHNVMPEEVIKWRWQAREGLVKLFKIMAIPSTTFNNQIYDANRQLADKLVADKENGGKYVRKICLSDDFYKDPTAHLINVMIERSVGRARMDDRARSFVISKIPGFIEKVKSPVLFKIICFGVF